MLRVMVCPMKWKTAHWTGRFSSRASMAPPIHRRSPPGPAGLGVGASRILRAWRRYNGRQVRTMRMRVLGKTGIVVSEVGVGCWGIGGPDWNLNMPMGWGGNDDEESRRGLRCAIDLGANHFDTADVYGHGHSERL